MVYKFSDKKIGLGKTIDEQLAEELHKSVVGKFKRKKSMGDLKKIFGQKIQLKWDHCLLRIEMLNTYYMSQMFSLNMHGLKPFFFHSYKNTFTMEIMIM